MIFLVTSRRKRDDKYYDEEQRNYGYDYLYDYNYAELGQDAFTGKGRRGFEIALLQELKNLRDNHGINTPKIGIYIHGYNNDFQESIDEVFDFEKSMIPIIGYRPIMVGFSWPSKGAIKNYISDREEVRDSVPAFTRFLRDINSFLTKNESNCFSTSYCVAHSMGNYLLRKGMEYLSDHLGTPSGRLMFNETIMIAPDLSSHDIQMFGKGQYISDFSRRVHVYYSRHDRALKASSIKRFGGNRLGRHGAIDYDDLRSNVIMINAEKYASKEGVNGLKDRANEQVSVHSSHRYHPNILNDIAQVLSSEYRDTIPGREQIEIDEDRKNHYRLI
ncbi:MAG: alpha/beta hydrolase [candidate division Zixibacteria bacterium]|nr:alpha/beta hydrolase [candidate division Zixibacteria bacterium]